MHAQVDKPGGVIDLLKESGFTDDPKRDCVVRLSRGKDIHQHTVWSLHGEKREESLVHQQFSFAIVCVKADNRVDILSPAGDSPYQMLISSLNHERKG